MRDTRHLEISGLTWLVLRVAGQPESLNSAITQPIATLASAESCLEFGLLLLKNEARMNMSLRQETTSQRAATSVPVCALAETPLRGVRPNIVQSIRAFRVPELQDTAQSLGQHFLYANLADAQSKQDVLDLIGHQFMLSVHVGKNFDALYDSMTDPLHKSGPQPGFIVVLEHIPANWDGESIGSIGC